MSEEQKRLVLIDGHAILHRAFHALPPLTTRNGELVNAVYGFASMLFRIMDELKPDYIIVAFDLPKPNFRHKEFVGYQAQRPKTDMELVNQIERVHELVRAFNIPIFEKEGFEADDVIGTLARKAVQDEVDEVLIVTGDRDLMQLVNDKVKLFMPTRGLSEGEIVGSKEVEERMGVLPGKIVDYKGLVGDTADNYPGVPGIGPKTAVDLLKKFGSLEKVYEGDERFEGFGESVKNKLREGKESALLSQKLATIVTNAPVELDLEKAKTTDYDKEKVIALFKELGFKSLVNRLTWKTEEKIDKKKEDNQISLF